MPAKLKHGVIGAPGGKRAGSGRKPSEFLAKCRELSENKHFFNWAYRVFRGDKTEIQLVEGIPVPRPASANEKTYLWEKIAAYGFGKPTQAVHHSGEVSVPEMILKAAETIDDAGN